jgi:hypothetical protein
MAVTIVLIDVGSAPGDETGDPARTGGQAVNTSLSNLKTAVDALQLGPSTAQEYTKTQNFDGTTLTDQTNISWDLESNQVAKVTLAGNRTLDNPTNMKDGATYILRVIQDSGGTNTLAYGSAYKWAGGVAPVISPAGNAIDILTFVCDGTNMYGTIVQAFA